MFSSLNNVSFNRKLPLLLFHEHQLRRKHFDDEDKSWRRKNDRRRSSYHVMSCNKEIFNPDFQFPLIISCVMKNNSILRLSIWSDNRFSNGQLGKPSSIDNNHHFWFQFVNTANGVSDATQLTINFIDNEVFFLILNLIVCTIVWKTLLPIFLFLPLAAAIL